MAGQRWVKVSIAARPPEKPTVNLTELAAQSIDAGYSVIVDAAFLQYEERLQFKQLAESKKIPFIIVECRADEVQHCAGVLCSVKTMFQMPICRVLEMQLSTWQPLRADEQRCAVRIDTGAPVDISALRYAIKEKFSRQPDEIS